MNEAKVTFKLGEAKHGRSAELIREYDGTYTIILHAASQRDDTQTISGLNEAIFQKMLQTYQFIKEHKI